MSSLSRWKPRWRPKTDFFSDRRRRHHRCLAGSAIVEIPHSGNRHRRIPKQRLEEYEILVRPDQAPTVQIESPRRNEERTAVSSVPIQALADDDYGIESLKLMVDRLGDKKHWEIPLVDQAQPAGSVTWTRAENSGDRLRFHMNYNWNLSELQQADLKAAMCWNILYLLKTTSRWMAKPIHRSPAGDCASPSSARKI